MEKNLLYFASESGYLYRLNKDTGVEERKKIKTKGIVRDILVEKEGILLLSDKGQLEYYSS